VQEHIRVGVSLESLRMRDIHAADNELPAGGHTMDVVTESYAG